ncbi:MAG: uroporphyrinogen decarboxylase family protein, partial [Candidatus Caldatribacteriaceae bacterium]
FEVVMRYASALKDEGADMIMVLEPTAVIFSPQQFRQFLAPFYREMVGILDDTEIILHVCGNTTHLVKDMADSGVAGLSLDSMVDLAKVFQVVGSDILIMGNINPVQILQGTSQEVYIETYRPLERMRNVPLFVLSSGCDLPQDVPLENIEAFFKAGRNWKGELEDYHQKVFQNKR